jgi:N-acetyl-gamma-glutamyl-phosphate reductase
VVQAQPHLPSGFDNFLTPEQALALEVDVCISCLPSGVLDGTAASARVLVDLADDHRWEDGWTYGLTEFARESVSGAERIANPGCYPTATLLALLPFARAGVISWPATVTVDAVSGVSGAGREARDGLLYAGLEGSVGAYGTTEHRHIPEIEKSLQEWAEADVTVSFTPHLAPMSRGLLATVRAPLHSEMSDPEALGILHDAYRSEPFVQVVDDWPRTKAVAGSNHAHVHARVDRRAGLLICAAAIDNLGKGAAGQAIQNANLALGIEEQAGLGALGVWP